MKPFQIPVDATAVDIIAAIDTWSRANPGIYSEENQPARLWHFLTALRGPDSGDFSLKLETTAVIRKALLPHLADSSGAFTSTERTDEELHNKILKFAERRWITESPLGGYHFRQHISAAARAILG